MKLVLTLRSCRHSYNFNYYFNQPTYTKHLICQSLCKVQRETESDLETCMSSTSGLSSLSVEIVFNHDNFLTAIWIGLENSLDRGVSSLALTSSNVPSKTEQLEFREMQTYALRIISSKQSSLSMVALKSLQQSSNSSIVTMASFLWVSQTVMKSLRTS